ncbi:MAG: hypothetical protein ACI308_11635 [Muribaculaceae bacterium]
MNKNMRIVPRGAVELANGEGAVAGEGVKVRNLRERNDCLQAVGSCLVVGMLSEGERVVMVDRCEWGDRVLTQLDGALWWRGNLVDDALQPVDVRIASVNGDVRATEACGRFVVVATDGALMLLLRTQEQYEVLDVSGIDLRVLVTAVEESTAATTVVASKFQQTYSNWTSLSAADVAAVGARYRAAVSSLCSDARAQGRLCGAVAARIGVRLWDDSYVWMSQPVVVGSQQALQLREWCVADVLSGESAITGVGDMTVNVLTYRLGITPINALAECWDGIVKAVDVLVSDEVMPVDLNAEVQHRCSTTTVDGVRTQQLLVSAHALGDAALCRELTDVGQWHVVSSTGNLASLRQGKWTSSNTVACSYSVVSGYSSAAVTTGVNSLGEVSSATCNGVMRLMGAQIGVEGMASASGRVTLANLRLSRTVPGSLAYYFSGSLSDAACVVCAEVTLATSEGVRRVVTWENVPFTPSALQPIIWYADARATHMKLWLQGSGDVLWWEGDLMPTADGCNAVWMQSALADSPLMAQTDALITIPQKERWSEHLSGSIAICANANALVWSISDVLSGISINAVAMSVRPLYGGGFGRYPLFLFAGDGVYALTQATASGYDFESPRLVSRERIDADVAPCQAGDATYFVNVNGELMRLSGAKITRVMPLRPVKALAWNCVERELWLLRRDGSVDVLMSAGRVYARDEAPDSVYSHADVALAVCSGSLMLISREISDSAIEVEWHSHPLLVGDALTRCPRHVNWSIFASAADLLLQVNGNRGTLGGYCVQRVSVVGEVNAPVRTRLVTPWLRSLQLRVSGMLHCGDVISPVVLQA